VRTRLRGFTLLELLVSMTIFAIMGVMAYRGYSQAADLSERARTNMRRMQDVQLAVHLIVNDFRQLAPRPVREPVGDGYRAALFRDPNGANLVELTRMGWSNNAGLPRGSLQRVTYALEQDKLVRRHWTVTDPTLATEPVRRELIDRVRAIQVRYLAPSREWVDQWPPLGTAGEQALRGRPLGVEVVIDLEDYGQIRRVVEVPG
jgi:general secretion pathway protein J